MQLFQVKRSNGLAARAINVKIVVDTFFSKSTYQIAMKLSGSFLIDIAVYVLIQRTTLKYHSHFMIHTLSYIHTYIGWNEHYSMGKNDPHYAYKSDALQTGHSARSAGCVKQSLKVRQPRKGEQEPNKPCKIPHVRMLNFDDKL